MDNSFKSIVDQSQSILIVLPVDPVFDEVAAGLALYISLGQAKKEVSVTCPSLMLVEFNRLVGVNKITAEVGGTGGKDMVIRFKDYQAENIDRVSYDIENGEFKLTVIPKAGFTAPIQSQMNIQFGGGVLPGTVILLGGEGEQSFPILTQNPEIAKAKLLFFGIQAPKLNADRQIISFARPASSVTEIAASIIKESGLLMDTDVATNLLLGIELSSNNFTLSGVTADTFQLVADLVKMGGKREPLAFAKQQAAQLQQMMQNPEAQKKFQQQLQQLQQSMPGTTQTQPTIGQPMAQPMPQPIVQPTMAQPTFQQPVVQSVAQPQTVVAQPTYQQPQQVVSGTQTPVVDNTEAKEGVVENPPTDWLNPKIYKGTSVS